MLSVRVLCVEVIREYGMEYSRHGPFGFGSGHRCQDPLILSSTIHQSWGALVALILVWSGFEHIPAPCGH